MVLNMLGIFKQRPREWEPETLPELSGTSGGLRVVVSNFPCKLEKLSGERAYAYSDFGAEFIDELHNKLGDFEQLHHTLAVTGSKKAFIKLRDLPQFQVEIAGSISNKKKQFCSDIADALINAFQSQRIKP